MNFPTSDQQFLAQVLKNIVDREPHSTVSEAERHRLNEIAHEGHSTQPFPSPGEGEA